MPFVFMERDVATEMVSTSSFGRPSGPCADDDDENEVVTSPYRRGSTMFHYSSVFWYVVGEHRTMRLIIIPLLTGLTTLGMTWLNLEERGVPRDERGLLISECVNYQMPEPWGEWLARWVMWHFAIFSIVEYKVQHLPRALTWVPITWGVSVCFIIWSGFHQFDTTGSYCCAVLGVPGAARVWIHSGFALVAFHLCWFESVCLWWPSRTLHLCFGALVYIYIIYYMLAPVMFWQQLVAADLEWLVLVMHLVVVWARLPHVKDRGGGEHSHYQHRAKDHDDHRTHGVL